MALFADVRFCAGWLVAGQENIEVVKVSTSHGKFGHPSFLDLHFMELQICQRKCQEISDANYRPNCDL